MAGHEEFGTKYFRGFGNFIVNHAGKVVLAQLALLLISIWASTKLTVNTNQLDLISQDLPEVKNVKRVIDMVGGAGYLIIALRSSDEKTMKAVADDLAAMLRADKENVRFVSYKVPVEFIQQNMVLFVRTPDLAEAKERINVVLKDQIRRNNPFFIELQKTEPKKLELDDIVDRYTRVGKKSILDDYYISDDKLLLTILVKPMWDSNELGKTKQYLEKLDKDLASYSNNNPHGVKLVEDYDLVGDSKTIAYGYTGSYKLSVDDSYNIEQSLPVVSYVAFIAIALITMLFFRKWFPTVVVVIGTVIATVYTLAFTWLTVGSLNMVTSMLGAILMGMGIDYGIHFTFRTRIELGQRKRYDEAIRDALMNAGRPAIVSAIITAGSFSMLLASEFRGFSQLGLLCAAGAIILGFTLFTWTPAILVLLGRRDPGLPERLIGAMDLPAEGSAASQARIPNPRVLLGVSTAVVLVLCAFAVPWVDIEMPKDRPATLWERLVSGVRFDYNTRALLPEKQYSVQLNDEIGTRMKISSDPIAVYSATLEEAREVWDELNPLDPQKYSTVDQVVSIFSFVPPKETAEANAKILAEWSEELKDLDVSALPPEMQEKAALFKKILAVKPFDVTGVPEVYASQFRELPTSVNKGYLTFIYPTVDLWDGKQMLKFADQTGVIKTASGKEYYAAGAPILYARLARIVLKDGQITLVLTSLWILLMLFLDFRRPALAIAAVLPLLVGLLMMLGIMSLLDERLNFMNIVILPILLAFGVSHGLYLLHRFLEGTSPLVALRSVGAAVAASTLTTIAGFAALFAASHKGLKSMGVVACIGLTTTLLVSFTVLAAVLQLLHDHRVKKGAAADAPTPEAR